MKCPNKRKTSELPLGNRKPRLRKPTNWGSLAGLAKLQSCSQRTLREWCKKGLIREAQQTSGGHWRIRKPLGWETRVFLAKRRGEWPFKGEQEATLFSHSEWAELLMLARVCEKGLREDLPAPMRGESDVYDAMIEELDDETAQNVRHIHEEIERRLKNGKPFWDWILIGSMYQWFNHCGMVNPPCPTRSQVAKLLGLSRAAFYRRYSNPKEQIADAYVFAGGKLEERPANPNGLDEVENANRNAKRPNFRSIQSDYAPTFDF
jgi:hypothetical protein